MVIVTIGIGDPLGQTFEDIEVTVATGSNYTALPWAMLDRLKVPVNESVPHRMADRRTVMVEVGETTIRLEGKQCNTRVIFAEEGAPTWPLIRSQNS